MKQEIKLVWPDGFSRSVLKRSLHHLCQVTNFHEICAFTIGFSFTVWTKMRPLLAHVAELGGFGAEAPQYLVLQWLFHNTIYENRYID